MDHTLYLQFLSHLDDIVQPLRVWCKAGAVDSHIPIYNGVYHVVERQAPFVDQIARIASPYTGFFTNDNCPGRLDYIGQLPIRNGHGAS